MKALDRIAVLVNRLRPPLFQHYIRDSANYWERRYRHGGNSGEGSYGAFAQYKSVFLNTFISKNEITNILDLGCGDGHQVGQLLLGTASYTGVDISHTVISNCRAKFADKTDYKFFQFDENWAGEKKFDLVLSLDVIYHLVEDSVYERYMHNLFGSASSWIIIYSSNWEGFEAKHVRHREFSKFVEQNYSNWKLVENTPNPLPSVANFYVYNLRANES